MNTITLEKNLKLCGDIFYHLLIDNSILKAYYGGNQYTDDAESINKKREMAESEYERFLELFKSGVIESKETIKSDTIKPTNND